MIVRLPRVAGALLTALVAAATLGDAAPASATGFQELGADLGERVDRHVRWSGVMRLRADLLYNLDLDRGPTPSGRPLFPVPLSDPTAQTLTHADLRLRTDVALYAPFGGVAVKLRLDVLDGVALGSRPDGPPTAATGQTPEPAAFRVKRAWAEALTPFGVLAAGRMGSHWGLGILTNGGDCFDCDSGDAADRVAFSTPLFGHILSVAFDFTAIGPTTARRAGNGVLDLDPADDVRTVTVAVLRYRDALSHDRRRAAGKTTVEYGAYVSHRWQDVDVPASYVPTDVAPPLDRQQVVARDFTATAVDAWLRVDHPAFHLEAEGVVLFGSYGQASLIPGVELAETVEMLQWGAALESRFGAPDAFFTAGLDLGAASGDPAFGFGVEQGLGGPTPARGDLDGPQIALPQDARFDNLRFHPDYHVDRILFREIIGTVTDAVYVRPHARLRWGSFLAGALTADLAVVASWALHASSTPGQASPLGVEVDPTLSYVSDDGLRVDLSYAVLFPLAGLDNVDLGLAAQPAQRVRLALGFIF